PPPMGHDGQLPARPPRERAHGDARPASDSRIRRARSAPEPRRRRHSRPSADPRPPPRSRWPPRRSGVQRSPLHDRPRRGPYGRGGNRRRARYGPRRPRQPTLPGRAHGPGATGDLSMFVQLLVNGLVTGSVYAIAGVGVSLVYGILRLVNFAYGDMMTFGAFAGYFANATLGLPMIASAAFAMVAGAVLAVALDVVLWRPLRLRRAGFMGLFLASIGVALVLRQAILLVWGPQPRAYDVDPFRVYVIGDVRLSLAQVATIVAAAAAILVIGLFLARTTTGRVMRAMSDDRALAQVSGIDVDRVVVVTWIISGVAAGLAGVLAALVQSSFD